MISDNVTILTVIKHAGFGVSLHCSNSCCSLLMKGRRRNERKDSHRGDDAAGRHSDVERQARACAVKEARYRDGNNEHEECTQSGKTGVRNERKVRAIRLRVRESAPSEPTVGKG